MLRISDDAVRSRATDSYWRFLNLTKPDLLRFAANPAGKEHYRLLSHLASQIPHGAHVCEFGTHVGTSALAMAASVPLGSTATIHSFDGLDSMIPRPFKRDRFDHVISDRLKDLRVVTAEGWRKRAEDFVDHEAMRYPALLPQIVFHKVNALVSNETLDLCASPSTFFVFLDTLHFPESKPFEYELLRSLYVERRSKVPLLLDDIHLNDQMERLWSSVVAGSRNHTLSGAHGAARPTRASDFLPARTYSTHDLTRIGHWSGTGLVVFDGGRAVELNGSFRV